MAEGVECINKNIDVFEDFASSKKVEYEEYIKPYINQSIVGMVDTCSIHLSSQRFLRPFCDKYNSSLIGYYWFTLAGDVKDVRCETFQKSHEWEFYDWDLMDFLITSPEAPIEDIECGKIKYKEFSDYEKVRSTVYPFVSDGAVEFASELLEFFQDIDIDISAKEVTSWINNFTSIPSSKDLPFISKIKHGYDSSHEKYVPICKPWFKTKRDEQVFFA